MRALAWLVVLPLLLLATGCSTFTYEFNREARRPAPTNDITGAWEGTWLSDHNGHNDRLRCLINRDTNGVYRARFHARYKRILHFGYEVPLQAQPASENGRVEFRGEADLGIAAGGIYNYEGWADPTNFYSTYKARYDHGTFRMTRPKQD